MQGFFKTIALSVALGAVAQARPYQRQASAQVITSCSRPNTAAITFDDGPYTWTRSIVDKLNAAGAKGTFFVNGNNFGCIYSYADNLKINTAIEGITGAVPAFIRPPYGEYNQDVQDVAGSLGQTVVTWDLDSGDAAGASVSQSLETYTALVNQSPNSILTLNHETHSSTGNELLDPIIQLFQASGYSLVTVAECVGMDPYLSQGQPSGSTGRC